jgi:hypothetical protein
MVKHRFIDEARVPNEAFRMFLEEVLEKLAKLPNTVVYVLSGMDPEQCATSELAALPDIGLSSENGAVISWCTVRGKGRPPSTLSPEMEYHAGLVASMDSPCAPTTFANPYGRKWHFSTNVAPDLVSVVLLLCSRFRLK